MHCFFIWTTYICTFVHVFYSVCKVYKLCNFCSLIKTIHLHLTPDEWKEKGWGGMGRGDGVIRLQLCYSAGALLQAILCHLYLTGVSIASSQQLILKWIFFLALEHHNVTSYLWHHFKFLTLMDWVIVPSPNKLIERSDNVHVKLSHQDANYITLSTA